MAYKSVVPVLTGDQALLSKQHLEVPPQLAQELGLFRQLRVAYDQIFAALRAANDDWEKALAHFYRTQVDPKAGSKKKTALRCPLHWTIQRAALRDAYSLHMTGLAGEREMLSGLVLPHQRNTVQLLPHAPAKSTPLHQVSGISWGNKTVLGEVRFTDAAATPHAVNALELPRSEVRWVHIDNEWTTFYGAAS